MTKGQEVPACPGCEQPVDPDLNRCAYCGYVHMARLDRNASVDRNAAPVRTLACPHCAAVNTIHAEAHNVCFSCGRAMYPLPGAGPSLDGQPTVGKATYARVVVEKTKDAHEPLKRTTKEKVDSAFKMFLSAVGVMIGLIFFFAVGGIYLLIIVAAVAIPLLVLYGLFLVFGFTFSWISKGSRDPCQELAVPPAEQPGPTQE